MRKNLVGLAVALLAILIVAPAASAKFGPCLPGVPGTPKCTVWEAKIAVVDDGDTVQARVKKGSKLLARQSVRINGLQAPELKSYSRKKGRKGFPFAVAATERLESLINKRWVRLSAQKASSTTRGEGGRVRARRSISVKRGGKWVDVGSIMIAEGWALPFPNGNEWASNGHYLGLAQQAADACRKIWSGSCGAGASQSGGNPLAMKLKWDAEDDDSRNINGEWVRLTNPTAAPVSLRGWSLRDSHFRGPQHGANKGKGYMFPSSAVVPALGSIRVHVGRGSNSATDLYWGLGESIFENATNDKKKVGDGAYLFDAQDRLRSYSMYPCRSGSCAEPLAGKVQMSARYMGGAHPVTGQINEWVVIKNTSAAPISLAQYDLESVPWFYEFDARDVIQPGRSIVVFMKEMPRRIPPGDNVPVVGWLPLIAGASPFRDTQANGFRAWNNSHAPLLSDNKDVVTLRNPAGAPVACVSWGGERCPSI